MQKFVYITIGLGAGLSLFLLGPIFSNSLLEAVKTLALIAVLFLLLYFAVYIFNQSRIEELKRITHGASISEIVETPSKAIPLAFVYGTGILMLGTILSILTAITLLASISVGYLQAERLENQNKILERQLPLLLRQSIMNNSNQLQSLNQRTRQANSSLIKLQEITQAFKNTDAIEFPELCEYISSEKYSSGSPLTTEECESLANKNWKDFNVSVEAPEKHKYFQQNFIDWLASYAFQIESKTKSVFDVSAIEDQFSFQNQNGLLEIIGFCEFPPDISSELIKEIYSAKRFESLIDASYSQNDTKKSLVGYKDAIRSFFLTGIDDVTLLMTKERVQKRYAGLNSVLSHSEEYCTERVTILANEKKLLEEAMRQDIEDLESIQDGIGIK